MKTATSRHPLSHDHGPFRRAYVLQAYDADGITLAISHAYWQEESDAIVRDMFAFDSRITDVSVVNDRGRLIEVWTVSEDAS